MSQLVSSKITTLNLEEGFSWFAVVKIGEQKPGSRRVLYQIRRTDSPIEVTIGLDIDGQLRIWVTDSGGKAHQSDGIPAQDYLDRPVLVEAEVHRYLSDKTTIRLSTGKKVERLTTIKADVSGDGPAKISIGATLEGEQPAAFTLVELMQFSAIQSDADLERLRDYIRAKYRIEA